MESVIHFLLFNELLLIDWQKQLITSQEVTNSQFIKLLFILNSKVEIELPLTKLM